MVKFSFSRNEEEGEEGGSSRRPKRMRSFQETREWMEQLEREAFEESMDTLTSSEEEHEDDDVAVDVDGEDDDGEGYHVITLSDPDVLDCPVCLEPLIIPVFQCQNGHIACSSCSTKVKNKCPSCTFPIGYSRCRALEKVIESVKISCRNFKYGCVEKTSYCDKKEHEKTCIHAACSCPEWDCTFIGSIKQLCAHYTSKHIYSATLFHFGTSFSITSEGTRNYQILREKGGRLFILDYRDFHFVGNAVTVSCIQPSTSKEEFQYHVLAKKDGSVLKLESAADNVAGRAENPDQKKFLFVPREFRSRDRLRLEVNIFDQLPRTPT